SPLARARAARASRAPTGSFFRGWMSFSSPTSVITAMAVLGTWSMVRSWASRTSAQLLSFGSCSIFMNGASWTNRNGKSSCFQAPPPVLDHGREERAILIRPAGIGLALVPDGAADTVGHDRGDHAVVEARRRKGPPDGVKVGRVREAGRDVLAFLARADHR